MGRREAGLSSPDLPSLLPSVVGAVAEAVERERVVTSKQKERLPRIPPPRRKKNRMNRGRKSEDIVMEMLTAVRKI